MFYKLYNRFVRFCAIHEGENKFIIFREGTTSVSIGFHAGPLSWSKWNLEMMVFVEGGKRENPEKNPRRKARTNNELNTQMVPNRNRTQATLVRCERIPAPRG